mmetsp:Transcript_6466/g.8229  ORF Transcript_6466/g.8229 Transcript_6466/m.8229 type:complete len:150 (-) Transcript_6466:576-1025(-)
MFQLSDTRKIGTLLLFLGVVFLLLGMMLFFDSKLLAMGNIMFLVGFTFLSGIRRTLEFFGFMGDRMKERWQRRWRGIITFLGGIMLVMSGWGVIGMMVEIFGFLNLFGTFFPLVFSFLRTLPVIGPFLNLPGVSKVVDKISGKTSSSMV